MKTGIRLLILLQDLRWVSVSKLFLIVYTFTTTTKNPRCREAVRILNRIIHLHLQDHTGAYTYAVHFR